MILVTHAFSRRNSGDSLLVDLTLARLRDAGIPSATIRVLALDPASFGDLQDVVRVPGEPWARASPDLARGVIHTAAAGVSALCGMRIRLGPVARELNAAAGIVAVGGGYLRTGTVLNSLGVAVNHAPQLAMTAKASAPSIYLPQSIGPLRGPMGWLVRRWLSTTSVVHARDDRTLAELRGVPGVRRTPDLAVLAVADRRPAARAISGRPVLVGRSLPRAADYSERLRELAGRIVRVRWATQAVGLGGRSDDLFYAELGVGSVGGLSETLATDPGVVVSVRLHGALEALLAGVPAIHLAYERKGWGAYQDLGLSSFVHSARAFDPEVVAAQVRDVEADPGRFWSQLARRAPRLREVSARLTEEIREVLGLGSGSTSERGR